MMDASNEAGGLMVYIFPFIKLNYFQKQNDRMEIWWGDMVEYI